MTAFAPSLIAQAATFEVDTTVDSDSGTYQVCSAAADDCSLRGAILKANSTAGVDTISVPIGTYSLSLGSLVIDSSLSLIGSGAGATIIDGNEESRVVLVYGSNGPTVSISDLTVRNGRGDVSETGGGVRVYEGAYVTIFRSIIEDNGGIAPGGGLSNSGTLILVESTVRNNDVPFDQNWILGGLQHSGGGLFNETGSTLRIIRSTVSGNTASRGGGIRNQGHLEITNSTISGNYALARGGGIMNFGNAWIAFSTITDNEIEGLSEGDDIYSGGGGIYNDPGNDPDPQASETARVSIGNSIVAENRDNQLQSSDTYSPDCFSIDPSSFTSFRGNVIGIVRGNCNLADSIFGTDASFDQTGFLNFPLNPWLLPLAYNGGDTRTHAIQQVSPALDEGDGVTSADFFDCPTTDQRGISRPQGEECDAGAYEIEQTFVPLGLDYVSNPIPPTVPRVLIAIPADPNFDPARQLDLSSLRFGVTGEEMSLERFPGSNEPACTLLDANADGLDDLVCKFSVSDTGFECRENSAILQASFREGFRLLVATGTITIGPCDPNN